MRIETKDKNRTKSFKLKDMVGMQIARMESVQDVRTMEPNKDGEEFALDCLKTINSLYADDFKITKQNMRQPSWKHFKSSCNREWHILKTRNLYLRSYYNPEDRGWLKLKVDADTPAEVFNKLGLQSKDRIAIRIEKHNERLDKDTKLIGLTPKGRLPSPE